MRARRTRKQRNMGVSQKKKDGAPERSGDKVKGGGQTLDGFNRRTGQRNWRYRCDSEYHLAQEYPWYDTPGRVRRPTPQEREKARKPYYSTISTDPPVSFQKVEHLNGEETKSECEQPFSAKLDVGGLFMVSEEDSVAELDTGVKANSVCFRRLG